MGWGVMGGGGGGWAVYRFSVFLVLGVVQLCVMDGGHIVRIAAVHPVHPQTPVTRIEESLSIIHLPLQVTFNYLALYICHAPIEAMIGN